MPKAVIQIPFENKPVELPEGAKLIAVSSKNTLGKLLHFEVDSRSTKLETRTFTIVKVKEAITDNFEFVGMFDIGGMLYYYLYEMK